MWFNNLFQVFLFISIICVIVEFSKALSCNPRKIVLLSNCSFDSSYSNMTIDTRILSMVVPYSLGENNNNNNNEEDSFIKILLHNKSDKPLISFNLNLIQCDNNKVFSWTSVESSSTLRGEFVRTTFSDVNTMYLSSGITYLRNLTSIDCVTNTTYRTHNKELFQINLKVQSTLSDYCIDDNSCYPSDIYQCDKEQHQCTCRSQFQPYLNKDQRLICIRAVENIEQCSMKNVHCLEWCSQNRSSTVCICPKDISRKRALDNDRAYCEGRTNGLCNSLIQCPSGHTCVHETCQHTYHKLYDFIAFDTGTISIIVSSVILFMIITLLVISIWTLRRRQWKKHYRSSIDSVCNKKQQTHIPTSNYDNIIYGVFHNNVQCSSTIVSSNDVNVNDISPFTSVNSSTYNPKIVFLGGEQQLTAIYA